MRTSSIDISQASHRFLRRKRSDQKDSATPMPRYQTRNLTIEWLSSVSVKSPLMSPASRSSSPASWIVEGLQSRGRTARQPCA